MVWLRLGPAAPDSSPAPVQRESDPPNPLSPYALQKLVVEQYGRLFYEHYGFETVSLRYFNVFGPRQSFDSPYSGVIAKFYTGMLSGNAPTVFGDGTQVRDFVYVENVVRANIQAAEADSKAVAGRTFNIGGGGSISLLQLIGEINRSIGRNLQPQFAPSRAGDIRRSQADISAARQALGYAVSVPWQEGLRRTLVDLHACRNYARRA